MIHLSPGTYDTIVVGYYEGMEGTSIILSNAGYVRKYEGGALGSAAAGTPDKAVFDPIKTSTGMYMANMLRVIGQTPLDFDVWAPILNGYKHK